MDGRFIPKGLKGWKCRAVLVMFVNVALITTLISLICAKAYYDEERNLPGTLKSTVMDILHLTRERFAEGSRFETYKVMSEDARRSETIPALHIGLKQMTALPQQDHRMSVIGLRTDPKVGTTLMQHFRLQDQRIVVVNSSIYHMHTTVMYNVTSSVGVRPDLEFVKTNANGSLVTLSRTSIWCKGR